MMTITFNDGKHQIQVPQSWNEITLGNYEKWFGMEFLTRYDQIQYIANICNIEAEVLLESPSQIFKVISDTVGFVFTEFEGESANSIDIDGVKYSISFSDDLTLAEWVDIESAFDNRSNSRLSEILSILCRPVGETYDSKRSETRRNMFADLTMDKALPLLAFFLQRSEESEKISNLYSQVKHQADLYLELIHNFAENGDGTKSLPIWQRIKFYFLTKFLKKKLSRFLDSFSINSTKTKRRSNRINI